MGLQTEKPWIVIMTHGKFGEELKNSAQMILGNLEHVYSLSLLEEMDPMDLTLQVKKLMENAPPDSIILTDLFGGTPSNVAAIFSERFPVISGVNLPMIIEAEMLRIQENYSEIERRVREVGIDGIKDISELMKQREARK